MGSCHCRRQGGTLRVCSGTSALGSPWGDCARPQAFPGPRGSHAHPVLLAEGLSSGRSGSSELGDPTFLLSVSWLLRGGVPSSGARPATVEGAPPSAACRDSSRDTCLWARGLGNGRVPMRNCAGPATPRPVSSCLVLGGHPGPALVPSAVCAGGGGEARDVGSTVDEHCEGRALCAGFVVPPWAGQREVLAGGLSRLVKGPVTCCQPGCITSLRVSSLRRCCLHSLEAGGPTPGSGTARSGAGGGACAAL